MSPDELCVRAKALSRYYMTLRKRKAIANFDPRPGHQRRKEILMKALVRGGVLVNATRARQTKRDPDLKKLLKKGWIKLTRQQVSRKQRITVAVITRDGLKGIG